MAEMIAASQACGRGRGTSATMNLLLVGFGFNWLRCRSICGGSLVADHHGKRLRRAHPGLPCSRIARVRAGPAVDPTIRVERTRSGRTTPTAATAMSTKAPMFLYEFAYVPEWRKTA